MAESKEFVQEIHSRSEDFSEWYVDVVLKAGLADYAPVRGCMAYKPYGYAIWEAIMSELDRRFKAAGVQNAYFPLLIPQSIFMKEAEHIEGFAPEVPWVTRVGQEELPEPYVIRPTSETIIGTMFAKWIESYRDLPMVLNQWCSVVRWEKATRPFLRTTEFLWQEGHSAHRTEADARERTMRMLEVYRRFVEDVLAIPVIAGRKSEHEKFAGAVDTFSLEALVGDGRALQAATSHYLGQGFAEVLGIKFLDDDGQLKFVHQTSFGASHRLIGALIMVHGDDRGLVLPPRVAPVQVVIVPIAPQARRQEVWAAARALAEELAPVARVHLDEREEYSPGWKFNEWELKGVPVRLELGPRDLDQGEVTVVRRDSLQKQPVKRAGLAQSLPALLEEVQASLFARAKDFLASHTYHLDDYAEMKRVLEDRAGFVVAGWCGKHECEAEIKEETGATIRCLPLDQGTVSGKCIKCGQPAQATAYFARAY